MRKTLLRRVYPFYVVLVLAALVALTAFAAVAVRGILLRQTEDQLTDIARVVRNVVEIDALPQYELLFAIAIRAGRDTGTRLTIFRPDGSVWSDSEANPATILNQRTQPEVETALRGKYAMDVRSGDGEGESMYVALPLLRGSSVVAVVRVSKPLSDIYARMGDVLGSLLLVGTFILLTTGAFAYFVVRRITEPIVEIERAAHRYTAGDLDFRVSVTEPQELQSLAHAMNTMAGELKTRIGTVSRQRNELGAILSSMVEGVIVLDTHTRVKSMNKAASGLFGRDADTACGKSLLECVRNVEIDEFAARAYRSQQPIEGNVTIYNETVTHLQLHATVLTRDDGQRIGTLLVLNDITRLKHLEQIRKDFVANVSHELKTPITSIKGFVETLMDGALDDRDQALRFLRIIANQTNRLHAIIEDLLSLSRLEQTGSSIELEHCVISTILSVASELCVAQARLKNITIDIAHEGDDRAWANPNLLEQAVVNLLDNAIKYSAQGSRIDVISRNRGGRLQIDVCDTGQGIARKDLPRLFERFYRTDRARSRDLGGTGLGLAIVKHICLAHRGEVSVTSELGKGSVFTLTIPQSD